MRTEFVTLNGNWAAGLKMIEHAVDALAATGQDIAERTRENMGPRGHFYDTGLSQDETRYEQTSELGGQVHIPTDYAAFPELGTPTMAPRPVLGPAIDDCWPSKLHEHWEEARLGSLAHHPAPGPAMAPVSRPDRSAP